MKRNVNQHGERIFIQHFEPFNYFLSNKFNCENRKQLIFTVVIDQLLHKP